MKKLLIGMLLLVGCQDSSFQVSCQKVEDCYYEAESTCSLSNLDWKQLSLEGEAFPSMSFNGKRYSMVVICNNSKDDTDE